MAIVETAHRETPCVAAPYRLLVFGDGETVRTRYLPALEASSQTWTPTLATTSAFAIRKLTEQPWDCVLVDGIRPDPRHLAVFQAARESRPGVPIVLAETAADGGPLAALCVRGGSARVGSQRAPFARTVIEAIESPEDGDFWTDRASDLETVLVIARDPAIHEHTVHALAATRIQVEHADVPAEGLARLGDSVGIVLTESGFPRMDSPEWLRRIRQVDPDMEIVALEEEHAPGSGPRLSRFGAAATLSRPLDAQKIRTAVLHALERRHATRINHLVYRILLSRPIAARDPDGSGNEKTQSPRAFAHLADQVLSNLNHGVVLLDQEGTIQFANPRFGQALDTPFPEAIGKRLSDFTVVTDHPSLDRLLDEVRRLRKTIYELHLQSRTGLILTVMLHAQVVEVEPDRCFVLLALHDLTDLRRVQGDQILSQNAALKKANAELERFAFLTSHDLKEPIRGITVFAGSLERCLGEAIPDRARESLHFLLESANRLNNLFDDLLEFETVRTVPLDRGNVSLESCVRDVLSRLSSRVAESGAEISSDPLPEVWGDRALLSQIYEHLIDNALKFVVGRSPAIRLTAELRSGLWTLGVRDNGIGIPAKHIDSVFAPCKRLHPQSAFPGSGLGLAVCRKALDRLGGRIWIESVPSEGTHVKFSLDYLPMDEDLIRYGT